MNQYQVPPPAQPAQDPGRVLGIVGLILAIIPCTYFVGLVVSIIGFALSRKAGIRNTMALAGIIIGLVYLVLTIILNVSGVLTNWMSGFQR